MKKIQLAAGAALALLALNAAVAADPTPYKVADGNKVDKIDARRLDDVARARLRALSRGEARREWSDRR